MNKKLLMDEDDRWDKMFLEGNEELIKKELLME